MVEPAPHVGPTLVAAVALAVAAGCGEESSGPASPLPDIELTFAGLAPLNPVSEGTYEVWVLGADGTLQSAGGFGSLDETGVTLRSPVAQPTQIVVTVEPPGADDGLPSLSRLLGGKVEANGRAVLSVTGYVTLVGMVLEPAPGVHVLGTAGRRGPADAGLWLVDARVDSTHPSYFQTFTPLTKGWAYEGWIVRDWGGPAEIWISYGQFLPNNLRKARFRDDSGIGPFSGFTDYERALSTEIHYPGDDWLANPAGHPVPGGLSLPLDLNGNAATGERSRWTHVITIEPRHEADGIRLEQPWEAKPFFLRLYRNVIGEDASAVPRSIAFVPQAVPSGAARIAPR
jgi:hypothetical protein